MSTLEEDHILSDRHLDLSVEAVLKAAEEHIGLRFPSGKLRNRLLNLGIEEFIEVDRLTIDRRGFPFKFNSQLDEAILALAHFLDRLKTDAGSLQVYSLYKPTEGEDKHLGHWQSAKAKLYLELQNLILLLNAVPGRKSSIHRVLTFHSVSDLAFLTQSAIGVISEQLAAKIRLGFLFSDEYIDEPSILPIANMLIIDYTPEKDDDRHNFYVQYELGGDSLRPELPYQEKCVSKWFTSKEEAFNLFDSLNEKPVRTIYHVLSERWPSFRDSQFKKICQYESDGLDMSNSAAVMMFRAFKRHNSLSSVALSDPDIFSRINETVSSDALTELERAISAFDDEESNIYAVDSSSVKKSLKIHEANPTYRQWLRRGLNSVLRSNSKQLRRVYILRDEVDGETEYQVFLRSMQYYFDYFRFDIPEMTAIVHRHLKEDNPDLIDCRIDDWLRQKWNSLQERVHVFITTERAVREAAKTLDVDNVALKLAQLFGVKFPDVQKDIAFYLSRLDFLYTKKMFYNFLNERGDPNLAKYKSYLFREFSDPANEELKEEEIQTDFKTLFDFAAELDLQGLVNEQTQRRMKSIVRLLKKLMGEYGHNIQNVLKAHKFEFDQIEKRLDAKDPEPLDRRNLVKIMRAFESGLYNYFKPSFEYFYSFLESVSIEVEFFRNTRVQSITEISPFEECTEDSRRSGTLAIDELRTQIETKISKTKKLQPRKVLQQKVMLQPQLPQPAVTEPYFGIITALPHEYAAVETLLINRREYNIPGSPNSRYVLGNVPAQGGGNHGVVLALLSDMGNNSAAYRTGILLQHFQSVRMVLMVGIAGGVPNPQKPDDHVRLGDIVVSDRNGVVQYDYIKEEFVQDIHRHPPRPPGRVFLDTIRFLQVGELKGLHPWEEFIDEAAKELRIKRPSARTDVLADSSDSSLIIKHPKDPKRRRGKPRVFAGTIGSANDLLKNPQKRDQLRDKFGVKAIEMEGSGIADATWHESVVYGVVRGICDYCDSRKSDNWQKYAAIVAAAFSRALLETIPPLSSGSPSTPGGTSNTDSVSEPREINRESDGTGTIRPSPRIGSGRDLSGKATKTEKSLQMTVPKYDVFISYRWISPDQEWVRDQLYQRLLDAGVGVCLDVEDFVPGRDLILEMERAGNESERVLCVISPEYFEEGRMVEFEHLSARRRDPSGRDSFLIPLILRKTDIPDRVRGLIPIDWTNPSNHGREWRKLLTVLRAKDLSVLPPSGLD